MSIIKTYCFSKTFMMAPRLQNRHLGRKNAYFNHGYPSILDSIIKIMIFSGEEHEARVHLFDIFVDASKLLMKSCKIDDVS